MKTRVNDWLDAKTGKVLHGLQVHKDGKWMNVCNSKAPCLFERPEDRDALRKELRRTPSEAMGVKT
jgi:hypothetical protein